MLPVLSRINFKKRNIFTLLRYWDIWVPMLALMASRDLSLISLQASLAVSDLFSRQRQITPDRAKTCQKLSETGFCFEYKKFRLPRRTDGMVFTDRSSTGHGGCSRHRPPRACPPPVQRPHGVQSRASVPCGSHRFQSPRRPTR